MLLDLKKLFENEEQCIPFQFELDLSDTEISGVYPFVSPVQIRGSVQNTAQTVYMTAEADFDFSIPCDRCAEDIQTHYHNSFSHPLVMEMNEEDQDTYILAEDGKLDLDELFRADILLALPTKYLCKEDCKGLCPVCGMNLNNSSCQCNKRQIDPRLEVLKQLID